MAVAALTGTRLCETVQHIDGPAIVERLTRHGIRSAFAEAMEFEIGILRGTADVRAFFHKVLGIVHSFRRQNEQATAQFERIADDEDVSVEVRAQAVLYSALTRVKMVRDPAAGRTKADEGLALLDRENASSPQAQRERGWLLNVRALCWFRERELGAATRDEKAALRCVEGHSDSSSVHLKINLISNISVLQERAGRPEAALRTWERFSNVGTGWDIVFRKHHAYRTGGLALVAGDRDRAQAAFEDAMRACGELDDVFHQTAIGLELGQFELAARAADTLGDPYQYALARTGMALAAGTKPCLDAGKQAKLSCTYPDNADRLAAAIESGEQQRLRALLPTPRTKLNRPFDHVDLW
jgi:hypothetical protein